MINCFVFYVAIFQVMSDNSSIVKTNTSSSSNVILPPKTHFLPKLTPINVLRNNKPASQTNPVTTFSPTKPAQSFATLLAKSDPLPPRDLRIDNYGDNESVGVNCNIVFPKHQSDPAILKFDNGLIMELDRTLFSAVEKKVKMFHLKNRPNFSYPLKDNHFVRKIKKRKHFIRRSKVLPERPQSRFMNILPKPGMSSASSAQNKEVGISNNPFYNSSRHTFTGSKEPAETIGE